MLIAKGYDVAVKVDGRKKILKGDLLHDPTGRDWPKSSCLIYPFRRLGLALSNAQAEDFFGDVEILRGELLLPPRPLKDWIDIGEVEAIDYSRKGDLAGHYRHKFSEGGIFFKDPLPILRRLNSCYRLDAPKGFLFTRKGIEWP